MDSSVVVVTGASGFIAKHVIVELLRRGNRVRGTLRDMAKADDVRRAVFSAGGDDSRLSFAVADLNSDDGWDTALTGATLVAHTASPFPIQQPDDADDVIRPARDGTIRVLGAATRASVRRVVITSSTVAIFYGCRQPEGHTYSEADFTDATSAKITPYIRSKTLAETAAWDFQRTMVGAPEIVVINPGFVHGAAFDRDFSTSHELFVLMARGVYPAAPKIRFPVAHVGDVAIAHAEALVRAGLSGERFLIAEGEQGLYGLGQILARELPDLASKVPKFELPDLAVRALAVVDKRMRTILPELGQHKRFTNDKARKLLGLRFTPADEAIRQSVVSLRALKAI